MNNKNFNAVMQVAKRSELIFEKGKGSWLWDMEGNKYLDFVQGWAVNALGHSPDIIIDTLTVQAKKLINASPAFYNQSMVECANTLVNYSVFDQVFFANSGAEANEGAIKLVRKWGGINKSGAWKIITFDNGFHGRTLTTMAASGKPAFEPLFEPKTTGFSKVPFNDLEAVEQAIDDETVAIMLEPIQGEAGVIVVDTVFLRGLRELADKYQLLLIFDEVQTGIARTGSLFCYENYGIEPDIMTLGKGLGGGVPISALLAKAHCCVFEYGDQGGTFNGNPLMTAVAHAVVNEVADPKFLQQLNQISGMLINELKSLSNQFDMGGVRGKGLLLALDTGNRDANSIVQKALERGLLINAPRTNTLRFMPALNASADEVSAMLSILTNVLAEAY